MTVSSSACAPKAMNEIDMLLECFDQGLSGDEAAATDNCNKLLRSGAFILQSPSAMPEQDPLLQLAEPRTLMEKNAKEHAMGEASRTQSEHGVSEQMGSEGSEAIVPTNLDRLNIPQQIGSEGKDQAMVSASPTQMGTQGNDQAMVPEQQPRQMGADGKDQAMLPASPTEMIVPEQQPQQMGADHKDQAMVPASPTQGAMVPEQGTESKDQAKVPSSLTQDSSDQAIQTEPKAKINSKKPPKPKSAMQVAHDKYVQEWFLVLLVIYLHAVSVQDF